MLIVLLLLILSSDRSLRRLGPRRWKSLHRLNYALFGLVAAHGLVYQGLEERNRAYILIMLLLIVAVLLLQLAGAGRRLAAARKSAEH